MKHEDDELPRTEKQWEAAMSESDAKSARYGDLLETLMDHPDRDKIIEQEMGWDDDEDDADPEWFEEMNRAFEDAAEAVARGENPQDEEACAQNPGELLPETILNEYEDSEEFDESDKQLHRIPAYYMAWKLSEQIDQLLRPLMKNQKAEPAEEVGEAFIQIKIVAAKIAGGHGMGYDDDAIGGNVVNCRRALAAAVACTEAMELIVKNKLIGRQSGSKILTQSTELQKSIENRIAELKSRMWWDKSGR